MTDCGGGNGPVARPPPESDPVSITSSIPSKKPAPDAALIDEPAVGRMLGCCGKTFQRRRVPGRVKVGRLTRYVRAEVEQWIVAGCPAQPVN